MLRKVDWLRSTGEWVDLKTLVLVESERTRKGITSRERRVYISSLDAQAHRMADCVRGHWHIENRLHWVLDVTFGEDASRVRTGTAPEVMAALRSSTLALIRRTGQKPTAARPAYAARPKAAIRVLMKS